MIEKFKDDVMEVNELMKRGRRIFDGYISYRKAVLGCLVLVLVLLYLAPSLIPKLLSFSPIGQSVSGISERGLRLRLDRFRQALADYDAGLWNVESDSGVPYVGNGLLGTSVSSESKLYIKKGRNLNQPLNYYPIPKINIQDATYKEAILTEYRIGLVQKLQSWQINGEGPVDVTHQIYAHRTMPNLLIQDIKIINPMNDDIMVEISAARASDWSGISSEIIKINDSERERDQYQMSCGMIEHNLNELIKIQIICVLSTIIPTTIKVRSGLSSTIHMMTSVVYSELLDKSEEKDYSKIMNQIKLQAINTIKKTLNLSLKRLRSDHSSVWQKLWLTGFGISHSKAQDAVNGDQINATVYHVLSQVRAPLHESKIVTEQKNLILKDLAYAEGCYGGHQTLQADRLWSRLNTIEDVNQLVGLWLLTLDKQGCQQLLRTGADGVIQAMVLSMGSLLFKNQHLELNSHPRHLHRDYFFRRVSYGNDTHLNISVRVQDEDYKAVLHVAVDRATKSYYACDAGCLHQPIQLGFERIETFPVKLTEPITSILYITADLEHITELHQSIHVKEVAIAPGHEHHVIALHRHGHKWAGLPTIFWLSIVALIVIFHLFLFKLVVQEYCPGDNVRYRKFSDF